MKKFKQNKAITLVALVITIIILLILAGITISQLTNSGLFNNTQTAKQEYANAQEREDDILKQYENAISTGEVTSGRDTVTISTEEYTRLLNASNSMNFSTNEKVVGTWINGQPIYQKTIDCGTCPNNTYKNTNHNIPNVDKVINVFGIGIGSDGSKPMNYASIANVTHNISCEADATKIVIETGTNRSNLTAYVTIQYTKTTDTVPSN